MTAPWLHIVGIGEDGMDGLTPATRAVVEAAELIIGGDRHHSLSTDLLGTVVHVERFQVRSLHLVSIQTAP